MQKVHVGVVTTNRADYGILYPLISKIQDSDKLELNLIVTGAHLLDKFNTVEMVRKDGLNISKEIEMFIGTDSKSALLKSIGVGFISFADYLKEKELDLLIVLGDRAEIIVPAFSALFYGIAIAHIAGGDSIDTYVTYDNSVRHAITKISHLHFVSTEEHKQRVIGMGEEENRIFNVGALGLDYIREAELMTKEQLRSILEKLDVDKPYILFTFHPIHTRTEQLDSEMKEICRVIEDMRIQTVITYPNSDFGHEIIINEIKQLQNAGHVELKDKLTHREYLSLMKFSSAVMGNSSSGIFEAPFFKVPTVDIGERQRGRIKAESTINVNCDYKEIVNAINTVIFDNSFVSMCKTCRNPYGDGTSSGKIIEVLEDTVYNRKLIEKKMTY
ncbi:MAG: hypothetical protein APF77_24410 [Clostridia bacterium BRH_c25]|nr:MAG: hypothetical protein APF77_24410 [Clostridia bacterium BRH_c25]